MHHVTVFRMQAFRGCAGRVRHTAGQVPQRSLNLRDAHYPVRRVVLGPGAVKRGQLARDEWQRGIPKVGAQVSHQ